MAKDLNYDLKIDGLTVYMNWTGSAASNTAKHIRNKYNIKTGNITDKIIEHFKCNIEKDSYATVYILTFNSERDMMYFMLHT